MNNSNLSQHNPGPRPAVSAVSACNLCLMNLFSLQPLPHTANSVLLRDTGTRAGAYNVKGEDKVVGRKVPKGARERRRVRLLADIHVFLVFILIKL